MWKSNGTMLKNFGSPSLSTRMSNLNLRQPKH
jgi:hypothetical protein